MNAKIVKVEARIDKMGKAIDIAVKAIHNKGVIIFPTETAYGLGCDATNEEAIKKIFDIKGRDAQKSLPIVVSDAHMAREYALLNPKAEYLMEKYMPGPLTLVVERKGNLPDVLSKEGVAFRIPSKEFTRILVQEAGVPIVSTSANYNTEKPLYRILDVIDEFKEKVNVILDAGDLPPVHPSTIIDLRTDEPKVLREGPLSSKELLRELEKFQR